MIDSKYKNQIQTAINLINNNNFDGSIDIVEKLIKKFPDDFFLENFYGTILLNVEQYDKAEEYFRLSTKHNNKFSPAYYNLGLLFYQKKEYKNAIENFLLALSFNPEHTEAIFHIAESYQFLNFNDEAINYFLKLLKLDNKNKEIFYKIALNYLKKEDYINTISYLFKFLDLDKNNYKCLYLLGWVHEKIKNFPKALEFYNSALEIKPTAEVYHGIGAIYKELRFLDLALENYEKCLIIEPNYLPALNNIGTIKILKNDYFEAVNYFEKFLKLKNNSSGVLLNMAQAQFAILNFDDGLTYFEESIKHDFSEKNFEKYLFSSLYLKNFEKNKYLILAEKFSKILNKKKIDNYKLDLNNNNLIIGFVSGDFREHAVSYQISGLIKRLKNFHDIKLFAYYNNNYEDKKTKELKSIFDKFENIFYSTDDKIIKKIIDDKVNILVDLSGYSSHNRLPIFLAKPAPVQITALGFLQTTGLKEIDYILADQNTVINDKDFTEKILRIKNTWATLDLDNICFDVGELPAKINQNITFGAFNNFHKLNMQTFNLWSKILKNIKKSKILFNNHTYKNLNVKNYLYSIFEKNNIDRSRIIIEEGGNREKILKDYNKIDILLDTYPYGGGTTSLEAAWMCVPILTISGNSFVSRGATSVNLNLGMSEWNCANESEYLEKAIKFSSNVDLLSKIKSQLIKQRKNNIFDNDIYANNFYFLIKKIWNDYLKKNTNNYA